MSAQAKLEVLQAQLQEFAVRHQSVVAKLQGQNDELSAERRRNIDAQLGSKNTDAGTRARLQQEQQISDLRAEVEACLRPRRHA